MIGLKTEHLFKERFPLTYSSTK